MKVKKTKFHFGAHTGKGDFLRGGESGCETRNTGTVLNNKRISPKL